MKQSHYQWLEKGQTVNCLNPYYDHRLGRGANQWKFVTIVKRRVSGKIVELNKEKSRIVIESTEIRMGLESKHILNIVDRHHVTDAGKKKGKRK